MKLSFGFVLVLSCVSGLEIDINDVRDGSEQQSINEDDIYLRFTILNRCDNLNTTRIVFKIPQEVVNVVALPLPGFIITSTTRPVDPPCLLYEVEVTETIDTLTFTGILTKAEFQLIFISMQLRETNWWFQHLKFDITQRCGDEYNIDWVGDDSSDEYPAPTKAIEPAYMKRYAICLIVVLCFSLVFAVFSAVAKQTYKKKIVLVVYKFNLYVFSFSFLLLFTAYVAIQNIKTSIFVCTCPWRFLQQAFR